MVALFEGILVSSGFASILAVVILIIKRVTKDIAGARWNYCLWAVLILRLVIPPCFIQSSVSMYNAIPMASSYRLDDVTESQTSKSDHAEVQMLYYTSNSENITYNQDEKALTIDRASKVDGQNASMKKQEAIDLRKNQLMTYGSIIWLLGVFILGVLTLYANRNFRKRWHISGYKDKRVSNIFEDCMVQLKITRKIEITIVEGINTPSICGLLRPKLLLPAEMKECFTYEEIKSIIFHELMHIKHGDMLNKWVITILHILHWFNPFLWYCFRKIEQDCELACDEAVLSIMSNKERIRYGHTLIKLVEQYSKPNCFVGIKAMGGRKQEVKRRIEMIKGFQRKSARWMVLGVVALVVISVIGLTSSKETEQTTKNPSINSTEQDMQDITTLVLDENEDLSKLKGLSNFRELNIEISQETKGVELLSQLPALKRLTIKSDSMLDLSYLPAIKGLESLHIQGDNLTHLRGLEKYRDLTELYVFARELKDIREVAELSKLKSLELFSNELSDIKVIENLSKLEKLRVTSHQPKNQLSIEGISNLLNLRRLDLACIAEEQLELIKGLSQLEMLVINDSHITDLKFLENHGKLKHLNLMNDGISNIQQLPELKYLEYLSLSGNAIDDIAPLARYKNLKAIELGYNKITNIQSLRELAQLETLWLSDNEIEDVQPLQNLKKLEKLDIRSNNITDVKPLKDLESLKSLLVSNNPVVDWSPLDSLENCGVEKYE